MDMVEERLDRAMATEDWLSLFPYARLLILMAAMSDHNPIFLMMDDQPWSFFTRKIRFENAWFREPELQEIVSNSQVSSSHDPIISKLNRITDDLYVWGRNLKARFRDEIQKCKTHMERIRDLRDADSVTLYESLRDRLSNLIVQEEM